MVLLLIVLVGRSHNCDAGDGGDERARDAILRTMGAMAAVDRADISVARRGGGVIGTVLGDGSGF